MDLKGKLSLHLNSKSKKTEDKKIEQQENELIYEPIHQEHQLSDLLPGKVIQSDFGEFLLVEYRYPLHYFHGRIHLGGLSKEDMSVLGGVLKNQDLILPENLQNFIFMDTETTGLAGGAGTFAFLIGIGYFEEDEFVLQQYMMEDYHQELAMLDALYRKMQNFSHLVTFNGKSYDWPLLEGRLVYNRMKEDFCPIHVDLLHPARRYYKSRLESCNLGSLEREILDFIRANDISGSEVPALFFRFLDDKDGRILLPVFQHNHWDILSLVTLLTHLIQVFQSPKEVLDRPEDLFSAGKIYEDLGQVEQALLCYSHTLKQDIHCHFRQDVLKRLSFFYKRIGNINEAITIWQELIQSESNLHVFPYIELAKYFEHQCKDYHLALQMTDEALELVRKQRRLYSRARVKELESQLDHRKQRLVRKIGNESSLFVKEG